MGSLYSVFILITSLALVVRFFNDTSKVLHGLKTLSLVMVWDNLPFLLLISTILPIYSEETKFMLGLWAIAALMAQSIVSLQDLLKGKCGLGSWFARNTALFSFLCAVFIV